MAKSTAVSFQKALTFQKAGLSVLASCKKAKIAVPTYYYQLKRTAHSPSKRSGARKVALAQGHAPLSGFKMRRVRTTIARIEKLSLELKRLLSLG